MRLFVAIDFPEETLESVSNFIQPLKEKYPEIFWTKGENIHLTIKFLGETSIRVDLIEKIFRKVSQDVYIFDLSYSKLGYFDRDQLIIWQSFEQSGALLKLAEDLDKEFLKLGFKKEKRKFIPHVTVGRGKRLSAARKKEVTEAIGEMHFKDKEKIMISKIYLIKSILSSKGPTYERLAEMALQRGI